MNKSFKLLTSILSISLLAGCGPNKVECLNHIDSDHNGKCDVCEKDVTVNHIDTDKNGKCDVCGADVVVPDPGIDFTKFGWDATLARLFYEKLGIIPPYVPNTGYKYEYGVDIFGDNYVNAYLFYSSDEIAVNAFNQYYNTCSDQGYIMTLGSIPVDEESYVDGIAFADKVIKGSKAVELTFLDSTYVDDKGKKTPALGIFATNYLYIPENQFPRLAIDKALKANSNHIPNLVAQDAEYTFYFGYTEAEDDKGDTYVDSKYLEIHIYSGAAYSLEEQLFNGLKSVFQNLIYGVDEEGNEEKYDEYPEAYYGQEFWCYNYIFSGGSPTKIRYCVQFGVTMTSNYDPYLYMIIYYDIVG